MERAILLCKISDIIHNVSVFPDLFHILIIGSNVYNSVCNKLILIEAFRLIICYPFPPYPRANAYH